MNSNANSLRSGPRARKTPNLATVGEAAKKRPYFTESSLRDKIYHSRERLSAKGETIPANGFGRCVVTLKRDGGKRGRILIDLDQLDAWIEEHRGAPIPESPRAVA